MDRCLHIALFFALATTVVAQGRGGSGSNGPMPQGAPAPSAPVARPSAPAPAPVSHPTPAPVHQPPVHSAPPPRSDPAPHVSAPPVSTPARTVEPDSQSTRSIPDRSSPNSNSGGRRPTSTGEARGGRNPSRTPAPESAVRTPPAREVSGTPPTSSNAKTIPINEASHADVGPPILIRREPPPARPSSLSAEVPRDIKARGELLSTQGSRGFMGQSFVTLNGTGYAPAPLAGVGSTSLVMSGGTQTMGTASALFHGTTPFGCSPYFYGHPGSLWMSPVQAGWWSPPAWSNSWCGYNPWGYQRPCYPRYYHGFGWSYSPNMWCDTWYPSYRVYDYYPWNYYGSCSTPVIATVWYSTSHVSVTETSDPYVEFADDYEGDEFYPAAEDRPGLASRPAPLVVKRGGSLPQHVSTDGRGRGVPTSLKSPLIAGSIAKDASTDFLAESEKAAREGHWLEAAESLRQGFVANPENAQFAYRLASCLIPAGETSKAADAIRAGVAIEGTPTSRRADLVATVGDGELLTSSRAKLERHLVDSATDRDARFVLGWIYFSSGQAFAARSEFALLQSISPTDVEAKALGDAAERLFLEQGR